ncbi:MAG: peroxiredoxin [Halioglobus sp.]|jgi:peroxiredoxin
MIAQESANGHFLVEFAKFTPPIQDLIRSFEGHIAEPFLANDVNGKEHYLPDYKGSNVILWFWSTEDAIAIEQVGTMALLQERNKNLKVIGFAKEPKAKVLEYLRQSPMDIDVIPNGEIFGQMAYGADMGSPRMFVIDEFGIIKVALPVDAFADNSKLLGSLESILNGL